jgi:hypothetical protein
MSLQETVAGHTASSSLLASSITLNPPSERFAGSVLSVPLPWTITDASHPWDIEKITMLTQLNPLCMRVSFQKPGEVQL